MIDWTARAKAYFSETGHPPTDKTDKSPLSSVLSVPTPALSEKTKGVSSVSSVGVAALFENRILAAELIQAAMRACDHHSDSEAAREQMRRECLETPPHLRQDLLDHLRSTYGNRTDPA